MLVCLVMSFGILTSCDDDSDTVGSSEVQLLSFGPSGVQHGEEIRFLGRNLDKVEAIELPGATISKAQFVSHTAEEIVLVVPQEAVEGRVVLKTPGGDITSKSILSFEVPVTVTSFTEEVKPGTNLTITGTYLNWVTGVVFAADTMVTDFVSQSMTELVVEVPMTAQTGRITILTGGTEPMEIVTEQDLTVTLPAITDLAPNPVEREANLTITGTDLDLVTGVLFNGITEPITEFVSHSPTEIVVVIPAEAGKGVVTLIAHSGVEVASEISLQLIGDLPPLADPAYPIYLDARAEGWENWGWGGASVWNSTARVRQGEFAAMKTYDGSYDAIRVHNNTPVSTAGYTSLVFSAYGDEGTNGKIMNIVINEQWGSPYTFQIVEGEWTTYTIPLSELGNHDTIGDILFQSAGWAGVVHYDHIGFE